MKLFFNASLTGKKLFLTEYTKIYEVLKGVEKASLLYSPVMVGTPEKVVAESLSQASSYFKKLSGWIREADVCIFETSYPSMGIGYEVAQAMQLSKSVILLHLPGKQTEVMAGMVSDKLQVIEYTPETVKKLLTKALKSALEQQDTRFNFFVSPRIIHYLDWVAKKRRLPRAVYLRRLIEEDMHKNRDYEG